MTESTLAPSAHQLTADWTDGSVEIGGRRARYRSAGHGDSLVVVDDANRSEAASTATGRLAADHRLLAPELSADAISPREHGAEIAAFTAALELGPVAVLGTGAGATAALWAAIDYPGLVTR